MKVIKGPLISKDEKLNTWKLRIVISDGFNTKDIRKKGFKSKKEANIAVSEILHSYDKEDTFDNKNPFEENNFDIDNNTFHNSLYTGEKWGVLLFDLYEDYVNFSKNRLKSSSLRSACDVISRFVLPYFNNVDVAEITQQRIVDWQAYIIEKGYAFKYKSKIYSGFTALLNYGVKFYNFPYNAAVRVGNFKNTDMKKEMNFWTEEEFIKFISVVDDELFKTYFSFLYLTGVRKGESLALTWDDINFVTEEVRICKSINRKMSQKGKKEEKAMPYASSDLGWHISKSRSYEITTPKNKASYRNVLLSKNLVQMLKEKKKTDSQEYGFKDTWFVFGGAEPLSDQTIRRRLDEYAERAGVKKIRVHDLRHSHASLLINKGQNIIIVSKRLGHSDITQTLNTYTHLMPNVQKEIIGALNIEF